MLFTAVKNREFRKTYTLFNQSQNEGMLVKMKAFLAYIPEYPVFIQALVVLIVPIILSAVFTWAESERN